MPDPTRNATTGETAMETADRLAGDAGPSKAEGGGKPHPSAAAAANPPPKVPQNIHPSSPGGKSYGSPIDPPLVK